MRTLLPGTQVKVNIVILLWIRHYVVVVLSHRAVLGDLEVILLCDQHCLQGVQSPLLLLVGDKHSAFFAVKRSVDAGHGSKLQMISCQLTMDQVMNAYLAEYVPDVAFGQALVIDESDGVVPDRSTNKKWPNIVNSISPKLVSLNIARRGQA